MDHDLGTDLRPVLPRAVALAAAGPPHGPTDVGPRAGALTARPRNSLRSGEKRLRHPCPSLTSAISSTALAPTPRAGAGGIAGPGGRPCQPPSPTCKPAPKSSARILSLRPPP